MNFQLPRKIALDDHYTNFLEGVTKTGIILMRIDFRFVN